MSVKIERLNNLFVKELSEIMMLEVKNPIMKNICITSVSITNDLSYAKVYFTCMDIDKGLALKELKDSKGFLRSKLCERDLVRHTPELVFEYDESIEYGKRIEEAIEKIHQNDKKNEK